MKKEKERMNEEEIRKFTMEGLNDSLSEMQINEIEFDQNNINQALSTVSYTHLTLPTTPYV